MLLLFLLKEKNPLIFYVKKQKMILVYFLFLDKDKFPVWAGEYWGVETKNARSQTNGKKRFYIIDKIFKEYLG